MGQRMGSDRTSGSFAAELCGGVDRRSRPLRCLSRVASNQARLLKWLRITARPYSRYTFSSEFVSALIISTRNLTKLLVLQNLNFVSTKFPRYKLMHDMKRVVGSERIITRIDKVALRVVERGLVRVWVRVCEKISIAERQYSYGFRDLIWIPPSPPEPSKMASPAGGHFALFGRSRARRPRGFEDPRVLARGSPKRPSAAAGRRGA